MVPGGIPGMALLPQQPGAPPIMVPIIPSTGAHLMAQQQQIRLAVAHAQAAAAAQTARVRKTDFYQVSLTKTILSSFPLQCNMLNCNLLLAPCPTCPRSINNAWNTKS